MTGLTLGMGRCSAFCTPASRQQHRACVRIYGKFSAVAFALLFGARLFQFGSADSELAPRPSLDSPVLFLHTKAMFPIPLA